AVWTRVARDAVSAGVPSCHEGPARSQSGCRSGRRGGDASMIVLEGVSKSFDGGRRFSVQEVSLRVPEGRLLVLLGGSGCGKTTTLKMINRLIEPTSGRILVGGRDVRQADPVELRRGIGYVFQGIGLFPHMSVAQNIA